MGTTENDLGIKVDGNVITNKQLVADHFNEFFINVAFIMKQTPKPSYFEKYNCTVFNVAVIIQLFRSLCCHVVCNVRVSCKANEVKNQLMV